MVEIKRARRIRTGTNLRLEFEVGDEYRASLEALFSKGRRVSGDTFTLRISLPKRGRSTGKYSQNAHINGHCQQIAMETGNSFQAVKEYFKTEAIGAGWRYTTLPSGAVVPVSEADASVEEAAILIETIHRFAAEWEIRLIEES